MKNVSVIVVAAGSGSRFGVPKQFLELAPGVRLVDLAVESALDVADDVVLVLPPGDQWDGHPVSSVVEGGESRLDSVAAGLMALPDHQEIVVVHDAAHPLAPRQAFLDVIQAVDDGADAALPFLPVPDVIKRRDDQGSLSTVGRDGLGLAQVPMAFSARALQRAHQGRATEPSGVWEDAMLVELNGGRVVAVEGSPRNIHIVTNEDLEMARSMVTTTPDL